MRVSYDEAADAAYVYLVPIANGEAVRQHVVDVPARGNIVLDFDADGRLLGVEILGAHHVLPPRFFDGR